MESAIDFNWIKTKGAEEYLSGLFHKGERKQFGLLEKPSLAPDHAISYAKYKIFLVGKSGSGKSSVVCNLTGRLASKINPYTPGIEVGLVYWPVRLISTGKILYFSLYLWDAGDQACKTYEHVLPACTEDADCILFTFSFTDRSSFNEVSTNHNQLIQVPNQKKEPLRVMLGTKTDLYAHSDLADREIQDLSEQLQVPVLRICNIESDKEKHFEQSAQFLNSLCNLLWLRDEDMAGA